MGPVFFGPCLHPCLKDQGSGLSRPTGYKVMRCFRFRHTRPSPKSRLVIHPAPTRRPSTGRRRLTRYGRSSPTCGRTAHFTTKPRSLTNQTPYKGRRVTALIQGSNHPALSDGSRLLWALPSPVPERSGFRAIAPDRIQGDAVFPLPPHTAQSKVTSRHPSRTNPPSVHRSAPPDSLWSIVADLWTDGSLHNQTSLLDKPNPIQGQTRDRPHP